MQHIIIFDDFGTSVAAILDFAPLRCAIFWELRIFC